jgi:subtilase family serine protease
MRRGRHFGGGTVAKRWAVAVVCATLLGGMAASAAASPGASAAPGVQHNGPGFHTHDGTNGEQDVNVCSDAVAPGIAHCLSHERVDASAKSARPAKPGSRAIGRTATLGNNGAYDPPFIQSAYNLASTSSAGGSNETVAIVDAYHDPNAATDLASYRSFFGLTPCAVNSCFRQVDEFGGTNYPATNASWGEEISLDLDMVSAVCPNCHILLVEAASASYNDLGTAVNEAYSLGANAISNSYGGPEFSGEGTYDVDYNHPGVAVTVSSGDSGYGVEYPAASPYVTAVGGTSLNQLTATGTRNATETAWSGAGSGCSKYEAKPTWQSDACAYRTVADVSAVADPNTGVWVYDTYGTGGSWLVFGGTSVASPIVASVYALAANPASSDTLAKYPYAKGGLNDVTSGSNGSCSGSYLCTAGAGYDGPTGLGTPNGTGPFTAGPAQPPTVPGMPTGLTGSPGNGTVSLAWSPPSSNGGATIQHYNVYRWTATTSAVLVASPAGTTYKDTNLANGTAYSYDVTAVNSMGEGTKSSSVSATPTNVTVPGAPTLSAAPAATHGVSLTYSVPAANGSAITGYTVYRGTFSGSLSRLTSVTCSSQTSCSYTDTSARSGRTYYYQVAAVNGVGTGPRSNQASARAT